MSIGNRNSNYIYSFPVFPQLRHHRADRRHWKLFPRNETSDQYFAKPFFLDSVPESWRGEVASSKGHFHINELKDTALLDCTWKKRTMAL